MTIALVSFNGKDIQSATYASWLEMPDTPYGREAELRTVQPIGRWGRFVRHDERERTVVVHIEVQSSFVTNGEVLARWFKPGTQGALVATFDGTSRALDCVVRRTVPMDGSANKFTAVLVAPDPRWRAATLTQDVEAVTASGQAWTVTNAGNATEDQAVFRVKPTTLKAAADDWRYKREIVVVNRVDRPLSDYAVELTDGGWDHAAEVTAGRSLASGDDVRVLVDGVEVPRWDGGGASTSWNDTGTKIWTNLSLSPGLTADLLSDITDVAPATGGSLGVVRNSHQEFPDEGWLLLGDEVMRYTGKTATAFTGITRGARGTTAAAATAGDTAYWVERRVQLMYGYTGASAPESRDERQPMIDLDTSTNTSHVWNDFAHATDPRSMQWGRSRRDRDAQAGLILAASGEPLASMVLEYQHEGAEAGKPNFNTFSRPFPTGTASGGTLSMTRALADTLAVKWFGVDEDGNEVILDEEGGPQSSGTKNITLPTESVYQAEVYARSQVVASTPVGDQIQTILGFSTGDTTSDYTFQQIVLPDGDGQLFIDKVLVFVQAAVADQTLGVAIYTDNSGSPGLRMGVLATATIPSSSGEHWATVTFSTPISVEPGQTVHLGLQDRSNDGNNLNWFQYRVMIDGIANPFAYRIISDSLDIKGNALADDGDQATFDGVTVPLLSTGAPYVSFGSQADAYWLDGTLTNNQTGQAVTFALLCSVDDEVEVDVDARSVRNITTDESVLYGATFTDAERWIEIEGGDAGQANELQYTEAGLVGVTVDTDLRSRWQ